MNNIEKAKMKQSKASEEMWEATVAIMESISDATMGDDVPGTRLLHIVIHLANSVKELDNAIYWLIKEMESEEES